MLPNFAIDLNPLYATSKLADANKPSFLDLKNDSVCGSILGCDKNKDMPIFFLPTSR